MSRLLIRFFWDVYDYIGRLFLLNVFAFILSLPVVTIPGTVAGLLYVMHIISSDREPEFRHFFYAFRHFYWRTLVVCLLYIIGGFVLLVNVRFYINPPEALANLRFISAMIAGIFFWIFIFLTGSMFFVLPALVKNDLPVKKALKRGLIFMLANPGLTFFGMVFVLVILFVSLLSVVGPLFFMLVFLAALANSLYDTAQEKVEQMIEKKEEVSVTEERKPSSWHEIKAMEKKQQEKQQKKSRYNRTLRDILKPWEYK